MLGEGFEPSKAEPGESQSPLIGRSGHTAKFAQGQKKATNSQPG